MEKIDAHQHFWNYDVDRHAWIDDTMQILKRDYTPSDLQIELKKNGMDGCVAVQADQSENETDFLLQLAEKHSFIKGVVGWLDLQADDIQEKLGHYQQNKLLKGLRHVVQDEPDDRFLLKPSFLRGIKAMQSWDLTYDILIFARHLPVAIEFASNFPEQKFVLDHIAKPQIKKNQIKSWAEGIRELAGHPGMYCKISGMVTEADWDHWSSEDLKPYLDVVFDAFGPERLMFGSDWPVCRLAATYGEVRGVLKDYIDPYSQEERDAIMGGNAVAFYNL